MDILHELVEFFAVYGYIAVFLVLILCGFGIPIPEDITLVAGGVICAMATTHLNVHYMLIVSLAGVLIGDGTMFMLGRMLGPKVKRIPILRLIFTDKIYKKMQEKIHRHGTRILFVARFLPGLRAPIFMTAGFSRKVPYTRFFVMDTAAALISVPLWVYAGYFFSHDLDDLLTWVKHSQLFIFILLIILFLVGVAYSLIKRYMNRINS